MTREGAQKHKELIQAFAEGKEIQCQSIKGGWNDTEFPTFDEDFVYRVKPEESELIPLDSSDVERLIGKAVRSKINAEDVYLVTRCFKRGVILGGHLADYDFMLRDYEFMDGSPIGKLAE